MFRFHSFLTFMFLVLPSLFEWLLHARRIAMRALVRCILDGGGTLGRIHATRTDGRR